MNIVFDWSGTLADDHITTWNITNKVLEYFEVESIPFDTYKHEIDIPREIFYSNYCPNVPHDEINKYAKELDIDWFASCWDEESLDFINSYDLPCIKIASACITNKNLMNKHVETGKPLIMSLIVPGLGQLYNKEPIWKPSLFIGSEILSLASILYANKRADEIRMNYQKFADNNWSLQNWWNFTQSGPSVIENNGMYFTDNKLKAMRSYIGTHHLTIHLKGDLLNLFNTEFLTSDSLALISNYLGSDDVSMVKDRHYYENIGKYDQFVGGWIDCYDPSGVQLWFEVEKDVGDSIEIIISTHNKEDYVDQRASSNDYLNIAKFAVSAIMFNHVISAMEAVWSSQTRNRPKKEKKVQTNLGLLYDQHSKFGVGGIAVSLHW